VSENARSKIRAIRVVTFLGPPENGEGENRWRLKVATVMRVDEGMEIILDNTENGSASSLTSGGVRG
jgi:hypothetical protein